MGTAAQKRALQTYRSALAERGLSRIEIVVRAQDRETIRAIAKQLTEDGTQAAKLREAAGAPADKYVPKKGGIVEALLLSPLASSGLKFNRSSDGARRVKF